MPSETPGRSPNDTETDGSWPEWLIDCGPTVSLNADDRFERHQRAGRRLERDFLQRVGLGLVLGIELEQDAVLGGRRRRSWTTISVPSPS